MNRFCMSLFLAMAPWTAVAATCDAGYYMENGECVICGDGFYCPGDDIRYNCPTDTTNWRQILADMGHEVVTINIGGPYSWSPSGERNASSATMCHSGVMFTTAIAQGYMEPWYTGTDYDSTPRIFYWHGWVTDGYYFSPYWYETWARFYKGYKQCTNAPANAHYTGPGTPDSPDGSVVDANDCPWACDAGFGKSASGECLPLCGAGITKIRAGSLRVPLFNEKHTSPSLAVEYAGRVCYADLVLGSGRPAINIDYHGQVYHTVNE